jgi:hypothetical protein
LLKKKKRSMKTMKTNTKMKTTKRERPRSNSKRMRHLLKKAKKKKLKRRKETAHTLSSGKPSERTSNLVLLRISLTEASSLSC